MAARPTRSTVILHRSIHALHAWPAQRGPHRLSVAACLRLSERLRSAPHRVQAMPSLVYIGSANSALQQLGSPLAKPRHDRAAYRAWLWSRLRAGDEQVIAALRPIREETPLVCNCTRRDCHAEVIRRAALWLHEMVAAASAPLCGREHCDGYCRGCVDRYVLVEEVTAGIRIATEVALAA